MPYVANTWTLDGNGQVVGSGSGITGTSGLPDIYAQAQDSNQAAMDAYAVGLVDPKTGQLTRQPRTQQEFAVAQQQLEKWAQQQQTGNYDQAMKMLTGGANAMGGLVPGSEDYLGSGSSSGSVGGGFAVNQGLHKMFTDRLGSMLQNPGLSDQTVNQMIGKGNDVLASGENSAALELGDRIGAQGGGAGAMAGGMQSLYENYAGKKAENARDVTTAAEQDRENRIQQAMGTAGDYLGKVQDRMAQDLANQRHDRDMAIQMMLGRQYSVPNLAGQGSSGNNMSLGYGGGANQGAGPGSLSGQRDFGTPQMSQKNQTEPNVTKNEINVPPPAGGGAVPPPAPAGPVRGDGQKVGDPVKPPEAPAQPTTPSPGDAQTGTLGGADYDFGGYTPGPYTTQQPWDYQQRRGAPSYLNGGSGGPMIVGSGSGGGSSSGSGYQPQGYNSW